MGAMSTPSSFLGWILLLNLLENVLEDVQGGSREKCGWIDLAAPVRMEKDLAAASGLEIILEQHVTALHVGVYVSSTLGVVL